MCTLAFFFCLSPLHFLHVRRWDSSVESISFLAKYVVLLLPSKLWKKCRRDCRRLKMNEEKRKLDGMESSKSKSNAHCMHAWMT